MLKRVSDTSVLQEECFIVQYQYVIHDKGAGSNRLGSETVYSGSSGAWAKLRDWASAVWPVGAGCYSQAALPMPLSKPLYASSYSNGGPILVREEAQGREKEKGACRRSDGGRPEGGREGRHHDS